MSHLQREPQWSRLSRYGRVIIRPAHLRRTGLTAFIVGTWLAAINHWDVLTTIGFDWGLIAKIALNYLTPFVVANIGLLSRYS